MPMVTRCTALGCQTLTMGRFCVEHDSPVERVFVRGRPYVRTPVELRLTTTRGQVAFAPTIRTASERAAAVPGLR